MIIVSDDASADGTLNIVRALARKTDIPVRVIHSELRRGLTRNWNSAIAQVATEFCLKLDHDDLIIPAYARAAVKYLRQHEAVSIIAGMAHNAVHPFGIEVLSRIVQGTFAVTSFEGIAACRMVLRWSPYACSSSTIYRTTMFHAIGGFDTEMNYCNDRELWFRIAREGPIAYYNGPAAVVRLHESNFTKQICLNERVPFEFEHMFRRAFATWPEPELRAEFAQVFRRVAKNYAGSAIRVARRNPQELPIRLARSCALVLKALALSLKRTTTGVGAP
jgi:glycosyltransferase involved in cell wall biosynthesis